MSFLDHARATLDAHLPGLDKQLADVSLMELEQPGSGALSMFRAAGGPALVTTARHGLARPGDLDGRSLWVDLDRSGPAAQPYAG